MGFSNNYVQGTFVGDGNSHIINVPSGTDAIEVRNLTRWATPQNNTGVEFFWQNGMAAASALQFKTDGAGVITANQITTSGITILTTGVNTPGSVLTGTTITNAGPPVCSSANTGTLTNGNIVRIINCTGAPQLNGYAFTASSVTANTSFSLAYMVAPGSAGTAFTYRVYSQDAAFYPRRRDICAISLATSAVVTMTEVHGLTVGQLVTFNIPSIFGMTQMNGLRGEITAINTSLNTITVNIDSSAFTAFAFPTAALAASAFTRAQVIPFGDGPPIPNPLGNQSTLDGATRNTSVLGVLLGGGANGPAGQNNDVIYWRAWKASQLQTSYYV